MIHQPLEVRKTLLFKRSHQLLSSCTLGAGGGQRGRRCPAQSCVLTPPPPRGMLPRPLRSTPPPAGQLSAAVVILHPQLVFFFASFSSSCLSPASSFYSFHPLTARRPFYASPALAADAVAHRRQVTSCGCTNMHFISFRFFSGSRVCVCSLKDKVLFQFLAWRHQPLSTHQSPSIPWQRCHSG